MRILHTEASTGWGGQQMRILSETLAMQARGHEVIIACQEDCPLWQAATTAGIRLVPVLFGGKLRWSAVRAVARIITRERIEIVNTHSSGDGWSGAIAAGLRRRRGLPCCVRTRHSFNRVKPMLIHQYLYTRLTDFIITTGEAGRRRLMRENGIDGARIVSIPSGVDIETFTPERWPRAAVRAELGLAEDDFVWGMVAAVARMKGHDVLAEAAGLLLPALPQARLLIIGEALPDSPARIHFEQRLQELNIADRFMMLGYRKDVARLLAACDACVLPSELEGVPQAIMQAQAMGKPVVATDVGSVAEIVRDGDTGLLIKPHDPVALAAALRQIMEDAPGASKLAARGQALIRAQYSLACMMERTERVYEQLLATAKG